MALDLDEGYVAHGLAQGDVETTLPIFNVERVQLQFNIASDFVAGQVANNVLILALATGRILRIDLESPSDIDGLYSSGSMQHLMVTDFFSQQMSTFRRRPARSASYDACS